MLVAEDEEALGGGRCEGAQPLEARPVAVLHLAGAGVGWVGGWSGGWEGRLGVHAPGWVGAEALARARVCVCGELRGRALSGTPAQGRAREARGAGGMVCARARPQHGARGSLQRAGGAGPSASRKGLVTFASAAGRAGGHEAGQGAGAGGRREAGSRQQAAAPWDPPAAGGRKEPWAAASQARPQRLPQPMTLIARQVIIPTLRCTQQGRLQPLITSHCSTATTHHESLFNHTPRDQLHLLEHRLGDHDVCDRGVLEEVQLVERHVGVNHQVGARVGREAGGVGGALGVQGGAAPGGRGRGGGLRGCYGEGSG